MNDTHPYPPTFGAIFEEVRRTFEVDRFKYKAASLERAYRLMGKILDDVGGDTIFSMALFDEKYALYSAE